MLSMHVILYVWWRSQRLHSIESCTHVLVWSEKLRRYHRWLPWKLLAPEDQLKRNLLQQDFETNKTKLELNIKIAKTNNMVQFLLVHLRFYLCIPSTKRAARLTWYCCLRLSRSIASRPSSRVDFELRTASRCHRSYHLWACTHILQGQSLTQFELIYRYCCFIERYISKIWTKRRRLTTAKLPKPLLV